MNYEFKHLGFLAHRVSRGDRLNNEDYIFLTELRECLRMANEHMNFIDETMEEILKNC